MGNRNKAYIEQRTIESALYLIENKATIRDTARRFGVSKSTTHNDLINRLPKVNQSLYREAIGVLDTNKEERHLRGGLATKERYERKGGIV